jgi:hypothetical protein
VSINLSFDFPGLDERPQMEELVEQFIPSDPSWKGWVKMALHQPLIPVLPVARELFTKTKWIARKGGHLLDSHDPSMEGSTEVAKRPRRSFVSRSRPATPNQMASSTSEPVVGRSIYPDSMNAIAAPQATKAHGMMRFLRKPKRNADPQEAVSFALQAPTFLLIRPTHRLLYPQTRPKSPTSHNSRLDLSHIHLLAVGLPSLPCYHSLSCYHLLYP